MRTRSRLLPGVLALLALTVGFTETVLASACAVGMCAPMAVAAAAVEAEEAADIHDDPGRDGGEEQPCPFGPLVALQGCTAVASLATEGADTPRPPVVRFLQGFPVSAASGSLTASALFRPPRA